MAAAPRRAASSTWARIPPATATCSSKAVSSRPIRASRSAASPPAESSSPARSARALASDPAVWVASSRAAAIRRWALASTSANSSSALETWPKAVVAVSRCGGISAARARNRSPSLPTQPPESSPPMAAAASPATDANRP